MRISDWSSDVCSSDLIVTFRKPGENAEPVSGCFDEWHGEGDGPDPSKFTTSTAGRNWYSIEVWQRYASPVWMDINQSRTLQYSGGRDSDDERHISPLQLDVTERCIDRWSNPGDQVRIGRESCRERVCQYV